ncbi:MULTISPECIES: hypothetical protein [unclassified Bradyrhizobium]|uniref:hypothetical protein n=1 Tax=unclassified Bradyrhizobium TaxID=2631580 RepID=UPI000A866650|nr:MULTISPECIES: hypothetical protein [unclassified Bradyrhizobium]
MIRVLLSARDAAAAHHVAEMLRLGARPGWQVVLVAQAPALQILQQRGHDCIEVPLSAARIGDEVSAARLRSFADMLLEREKPDVIIAGLSSPGDGGIDEALLAMRKVPALLMQDFWGEQNVFFGRGADSFLALDEFAVTLNDARYGKPSFVVGSPRHASLAELDVTRTRSKIRQNLQTKPEHTVVGWFGQSLHHLPGYRKSIREWIAAVAALGEIQVLYKPHPRESDNARQETSALLTSYGLTHHILSDWSIECALLACDVASSILSNCLYDAAYLNHFSPEPLAAPVAWLVEPDIQEFFDAVVPAKQLPYANAGLALLLYDTRNVAEIIDQARKAPERTALWRAAQQNLVDPLQANDLVASAILSTLG